MKWKIAIFALIIILVSFSYGFSEEVSAEGEVGIKGVYAGVRGGEGGEAKFTEYRDLKQGVSAFGKARLNFDSEKYFLNFQGGDFAYDTQFYGIEGGRWGKFKFDLFYNEIPHNLTFDGRTFFQGAGSHNLTGTPNTNFSSWNTFDYSIERKQYGGGLKIPMLRPFYLDVSFQREERNGIKPAGIATGSPGSIPYELPEPVDYTTNNLMVEGGYAKYPLFLSLGFIFSDFNDSNDRLNFTHPVAPFPTDTLTLPPDNTYYKGFFKGAVKLPLNSKFNVNLGYASAKSNADILTQFITDGTINPVALSDPRFDGKIDTQNYSFALTSNPLRFLDGKIFYSYFKRDNKNDVIVQNAEFNRPFEYRKNAAGIDLGSRLPANVYLSAGYKYIKTDRRLKGVEAAEELIPPDNEDNIFSVDVRWAGLDFMALRAGYERLDRGADFTGPVPFNRRSAYTSFDRDTYKASVDLYPIENLDLGFGYLHKRTDYKEIFGLKKDKRHEFETSADYLIGKIAKLYGFLNLEWIRFIQDVQNSSPLGAFRDEQKERTYGYGIGTEIYVVPQKLTFMFQHDYEKSNGGVDLTLDPALFVAGTGLGPGSGANNDNIDIINLDDYTKYVFKFKAAYHVTKFLIVSGGYVYERFKFNDVQLDNYQFTPSGPTSNTAFLTGAFKDQSYKANLVFGGVTYKF